MKKVIAFMVTLTMVASMAGTFVAAPTVWNPDPGETRESDSNPEVIPMYGYIGPVVENPTDPDPDDPEVNPWKGLDISVPVKFIWAAFEPEIGATAQLESPQYNIINRSEVEDIEVIVTNFTPVEALNPTVGTVEIELVKDAALPSIDANETLWTAAGAEGAFPASLGEIDRATGSAATDWTKWTFSVGGEFKGANDVWPAEIQLPEYDVEFQFKVATP